MNDIGEVMEDNENPAFNIQEFYQVTKKCLKSQHLYHRLLFMKLNGYQLGFKVLENAGLNEN